MRRSAGLVVTLVAAALAPGTAGAAQGPWYGPAASLSAAGHSASSVDLAVAPDGTATAVWYRENDAGKIVVQASTRPPGGSFSAGVDVSAPGVDALDPQVAVAPDGTTTVVWYRPGGIQSSTRPPSGSFSAPVDLSAPGQSAADPQLAVGPDGTTTVVWRQYDGSNYITQASTRPPGGSFSAPVALSGAGRGAEDAQVAVAADGTTTAIWRRYNGANKVIQASTRPPGGSFTPAIDLSLAGADALSPQIALAPSGAATVVWTRSNGTAVVVQATTRQVGGAFTDPFPLSVSAAGANASVPQVAAAPDGRVTVVWLRYNGADDIVQATTSAADGAFSYPVNLSAPGRNAYRPQLAVGPDGTATALWSRSDGSDDILQTSTRPPGGAFASPLDLTVTGQSVDYPQIGVASDGSLAAAWVRGNGSNDIAQGTFTANPPASRIAPAVIGAPALGIALSCDGGSWTGAAALSIDWLRGATVVGGGSTYTVGAADQGGSLACRVQATNPFGAAQALSAAVSVAAAGPALAPAAPITAPSPLALPRIRGRARLGRTLTCSGARFARSTRVSTRWLRAGTAIRGATRARYRVTRKDVGKILTCRTSATGPGGKVTTLSLGVLARR